VDLHEQMAAGRKSCRSCYTLPFLSGVTDVVLVVEVCVLYASRGGSQFTVGYSDIP
jgi:hypothetical protein